MKSTRVSRRALWSGVAIVLLAAYLRLAAFDEALVGADQSSILAAAADLAAFRALPLVGIKSSVGVMQTAVTPYLAALPLLLVPQVIAIKWFFSILDLLALALLFNATHRAFGRRAALVAALLYATNPWVVEFIRWIWYQTLISTFATMACAAFLVLLTAPRGRGAPAMVVVGLLCATLMGLVHLAAAPWAAALAALGALLAWRNRQRGALLLGLTLSGLVAAPYLFYLVHTGFADVGILLQGNADAASTWNWAAYRLAWELLTGAQVLQTPRDPLWAASVLPLPGLFQLFTVILALAGGVALYDMRRASAPRPALALMLAWTVLAPTLFLPTGIHLQHFYLLFLFPAPYVLIGAGVERLLASSRARAETGLSRGQARARLARPVGYGMLAALLLIALGWTHWWGVRIAYESRGQLRAPTRAWLMDALVAQVRQVLQADPTQQVIILNGFEGDHLSPFDWVRNFVHDDRVRIAPSGQGLIVPAGPTCYWLGPGATLDDLAPVAGAVVLSPALTIPATPPWPAYCTPSRPPLPAPRAVWQNGMALLHAEIGGDLTPGARLELTYTWHYRAAAPQEYHIFNHLLHGDALAAQIDGAGVPTWYWRDDDVLITHFSLQLPAELAPGEYRLNLGTYTWPGIERVALADGGGEYRVREWTRE